MKSAARIFQNHCAACHGADARGQANRFPNLRDDKWQWGGGEAHIAQSIRDGRRAAMPAWGAIVKEDGARKIARYALALGDGGEGGGEDAQHAEGKALYGQFCVACHGAQGLGNPALGAPNLVDSVWLYGGDEDSIYESIFAGRDGEMPAASGAAVGIANPRFDRVAAGRRALTTRAQNQSAAARGASSNITSPSRLAAIRGA